MAAEKRTSDSESATQNQEESVKTRIDGISNLNFDLWVY